MYGIYANIGGILMANVTIYSIHGSYGIGFKLLLPHRGTAALPLPHRPVSRRGFFKVPVAMLGGPGSRKGHHLTGAGDQWWLRVLNNGS